MRKLRTFGLVAVIAVATMTTVFVNPSHATLIGQGTVSMRNVNPDVYQSFWGVYGGTQWRSKYYDTMFVFYKSNFYDFFWPAYTRASSSSPWVVYGKGYDKLRWAAYWLAVKPQGDDAMGNATNLVTKTYLGRFKVFLADYYDLGLNPESHPVGYRRFLYEGSSNYSLTGNAVNSYSISLNYTYLTAPDSGTSIWTSPTVYNEKIVSRIGARLCYETVKLQWDLATHYYKIAAVANDNQKYWAAAFREALANYAGGMAYKWVPQAIASNIQGFFSTSLDNLRTDLVASVGDWYNMPSIGFRYLNYFSPSSKDRWQLMAFGYYLTHWRVGQWNWYQGSAVNVFMKDAATLIDAAVAGGGAPFFSWSAAQSEVFVFDRMSHLEGFGPYSYRSWWNIGQVTWATPLVDSD